MHESALAHGKVGKGTASPAILGVTASTFATAGLRYILFRAHIRAPDLDRVLLVLHHCCKSNAVDELYSGAALL